MGFGEEAVVQRRSNSERQPRSHMSWRAFTEAFQLVSLARSDGSWSGAARIRQGRGDRLEAILVERQVDATEAAVAGNMIAAAGLTAELVHDISRRFCWRRSAALDAVARPVVGTPLRAEQARRVIRGWRTSPPDRFPVRRWSA